MNAETMNDLDLDRVKSQVKKRYPTFPGHMVAELIGAHRFPGTASGFYKAVLDNDLALAVCRADIEHRRHLGAIALLLFRDQSLLEVTKEPAVDKGQGD